MWGLWLARIVYQESYFLSNAVWGCQGFAKVEKASI